MKMVADCCIAPPPLNPEAIIEEMVKQLRSAGNLPLPEPFTLDERRDAIMKIIQQIWDACELSILQSQLDHIIQWAFQNKPDAIRRSNLAAELLLRLLPKAEKLRSRRQQLLILAECLEDKMQRLEESRKGLRLLLKGCGISPDDIKRLVRADDPIGFRDGALIEFGEIARELLEETERFLEQCKHPAKP